jgi:hypothetical protein
VVVLVVMVAIMMRMVPVAMSFTCFVKSREGVVVMSGVGGLMGVVTPFAVLVMLVVIMRVVTVRMIFVVTVITFSVVLVVIV